MQVWTDYQEKNKDKFLNELLDLLRIPSVSAKAENKTDMVTCAEAVKQRLIEAGADKVEIYGPIKANSIGVRPLRCTTSRTTRTLEKRPI